MATPYLGQFLVAVNGFVSVRNEAKLTDYLVLEPPFGEHYTRMISELRSAYPKSSNHSTSDDLLEQKCSAGLPAAREGAEGSPWTPFVKFMVQYLAYLRDVDADPKRYLETYELLSELQARANSALNHGVLGQLMLPVVVTNAKLVCRLAVGLDRRPELLRSVRAGGAGAEGGDESGPRETLPERAANILRNAFVICLNDRASRMSKDGTPEGKKRGIYLIANLCLKILFQCRKTRNATQIFENIYNLSPPLAAYPKRERVTYLYYLGRFLFQNSHFYRSQLALQSAYDESPVRHDCTRQRRHILIYLIASNLILGRFPSRDLLNRPEAAGLGDHFLPLAVAIRQGNLAAFRQHLELASSPSAAWFLHFRILLQLRNRCEVLAWRSLVRKTWLLSGTRPDPTTKIAPTVDLHHLVAVFASMELAPHPTSTSRGQSRGPAYVDPDFAGLAEADLPPASTTDMDTTRLESILSSLVDQGLLSGYISRARLKFAITGTKRTNGDALAAGFPLPWDVIRARAERAEGAGFKGREMEVPGWKKEQQQQPNSGFGSAVGVGPGMVVNLSGLRPVGAAG